MDTCSSSTINHLFVQTCKAHRTRTSELLSEFGVHVGQEMILGALWQEGGLPMSQLAERLEVQPPTITRMIQRMENSGLVERRPCGKDLRVAFVHLTAKGEALREKVEGVWAAVERQLTQGMTGEEKALFQNMLARARSNLSKPLASG
jgi:DNA-binding MarR family transcriptional regulator